MNDAVKCFSGCKNHCVLCGAHSMCRASTPRDWVRVERGRYICSRCDYDIRMAERNPEYVARMVAMEAEAVERSRARMDAQKALRDRVNAILAAAVKAD